MKTSHRRPLRIGLATSLLGAFGFAACSPGASNRSDEGVGRTSSAVFANGDFESGTAGLPPPSWPVTAYLNPGVTIQSPQTLAGLNLATSLAGHAAPAPLTVIMSSLAGPLSQPDPYMGAGASLRWPRFGNQCVLVNQNGRNQNANSMAQTMTIAAGDVDPADGKIHVRFVVAPVLEYPTNHLSNQQPYFFIQATNVTQGGAVLYANFNFSNQPGVPWKTIVTGGLTYVYTDWQLVDIAPGSPALNMGDQVQLQVVAAGCSLGAHMGQVYVDGVGATVPTLFVSGSGPSQVNACNDVTYALTYENGGSTTATGATVTFQTPPNTRFQSLNAPGLTCTTPAVGAGGTVTCTIGDVAVGASGSFTITVNVPCGTTGTVTAGNYSIQATSVPPLLGPVLNTIVGCTADAQCPAGDWCKVSGNACTPKLANGVAIPTDGSHLDGTCTPSNGALVCISGVCDSHDNACGLLNGSGTCSPANAANVCRSGVCGGDGSCGYATGEGPCGSSDAATVCRSGTCSQNLTCMPATGCNVDTDCTAGNWCMESQHTCTAKISNGAPMPNDPPHVNPTLNGTCTPAAATLVCVAGVCDVDANCGLANGSGPCDATNAATRCRSGACSQNATCMPPGGCNVDADCAAGSWCKESTHTCMAKLANGAPMPSDPPHTTPALDGTCTSAAAALVCVTAVCDVDDACGWANGDGACATNAAACRSSVCGADGKCGLANGEGTCTSANGGTICRSSTCDTDGKCGLADGDGPCTSANGATICRSGVCAPTSAKCIPTGGCASDADCTGGKWCNVSTLTCTAKIDNGSAMPTDTKHGTPTLDGKCSAAAATLTCVSGVCDTRDDKCGYDVGGESSCTATNAATVCRSGVCSAGGKCMAAGSCLVDADCATGWCNIASKTCAPKIDNGGSMPTDTGHVTPTIDGKCNPGAGALVCKTGACDTLDDKCGLANGSACTVGEDAKCRAAFCFTDLKCGKPLGEACTASTECREGQCLDGKCDEDSDGDGVSDRTEQSIGSNPNDPDSDHDGVRDDVEESADHSGHGPFSKVDTDGDGTIDALDTDDDGDTVLTKDELGAGATPQDTDGDGKPDYLDTDDDDDTIPTKKEVADGRLPQVNSADVDDDGKNNWLDTDADGDGILDKDEPGDVNGDGVPDYLQKAVNGTAGPGSLEGGGCDASGAGGAANGVAALGLVALGALLRGRRKAQR